MPIVNSSDSDGLAALSLSRESVSQQAYLAIRRALIAGAFAPGEKLILRAIASSLGISPTPVREALLKLVSENLLVIDGRGTVLVPQMTHGKYVEIRDLRVLLEGESAARAAASIRPADLTRLRSLQRNLEKALKAKEHRRALQLNEEFHFFLCRCGGSDALFKIVENLWLQCGPVLGQLFDHGSDATAVYSHRKLISALAQGDANAARQGISEDIVVGGRPLLDRLSHQPIEENSTSGLFHQ